MQGCSSQDDPPLIVVLKGNSSESCLPRDGTFFAEVETAHLLWCCTLFGGEGVLTTDEGAEVATTAASLPAGTYRWYQVNGEQLTNSAAGGFCSFWSGTCTLYGSSEQGFLLRDCSATAWLSVWLSLQQQPLLLAPLGAGNGCLAASCFQAALGTLQSHIT